MPTTAYAITVTPPSVGGYAAPVAVRFEDAAAPGASPFANRPALTLNGSLIGDSDETLISDVTTFYFRAATAVNLHAKVNGDDVDHRLNLVPLAYASPLAIALQPTSSGADLPDLASQYSAARIPSVRLRCVAIGDSTTAGNSTDPSNTGFTLGNTLVGAGGIGRYRHGAESWFTHMCLQSNGRLLEVFNAGLANDRTPNMLARFATDVAAYSPDVVFLGDAHNDFTTGSGVTLAQTKANIVAMIAATKAIGAIPVLGTVYPDPGADYGVNLRIYNAWLKAYGQQNGILVVDKYAAVVDPASSTGAWTAAYASDNTHATAAGAKVAGAKVLADMAGLLRGNATGWGPFVATDNVQASTGNLLTNGLFINGTNPPTSWALSGTATNSVGTDSAVLGNAWTVTIASSNAVEARQALATGWSVGDKLKWAGLAKVTGNAGSLIWQPRFYFNGGPTYAVHPLKQVTALDYGWFSWEVDMIVPASTTSIVPAFTVTSGTGAFSLAQWQILNMTTLGMGS